MRKYPGQLTKVTSPSGAVWEYWFGIQGGKRVYLVAPVDSLNTWQFSSVKEVKSFIGER